jgi:predicted phage-related endonuclease
MQFRDPSSFPAYVTKSPEWHAIRAQHVGASEVAALFGCQANYQLSEFALYHVKSGVEAPPVEGERVEWGLRLEQIIAEASAAQEGWKIVKGGYAEDIECPRLGASLDHLILHPTPEEESLGFHGPGVMEVKNTDWLIHRAQWSNDEPPVNIALQLQAQIAATGYQWGAVCALVGGNHIEVYRFRRRDALIAEMRTRVRAFWERIETRQPPPVDGSEGAAHILRTLYPEVLDLAADMRGNNRFPEVCSRFLDAAAAKKVATKKYDEVRNELADLLKSNMRAFGGGFSAIVSITPAKPGRTAYPGEIIPGRAETRRITVKAA